MLCVSVNEGDRSFLFVFLEFKDLPHMHLGSDKMTKFKVYNYSESFYLPHLPKHTTYWVIYVFRNSENPYTNHHLEGKSKSGSFYPQNGVWYTTFRDRYFPKYLGNEFV